MNYYDLHRTLINKCCNLHQPAKHLFETTHITHIHTASSTMDNFQLDIAMDDLVSPQVNTNSYPTAISNTTATVAHADLDSDPFQHTHSMWGGSLSPLLSPLLSPPFRYCISNNVGHDLSD
eukprot:m.31100 g.31100  ORF g.31100 m.31100 type:complete len:121 (+) comp9375_c0_seq1:1700-2062(+)